MRELLYLLFSLSLSGAALTAVVGCLNRLLRGKVPKSFLYYLWLVAMVRFLCPMGSEKSMVHRFVTWETEKTVVSEQGERNIPLQKNDLNMDNIDRPPVSSEIILPFDGEEQEGDVHPEVPEKAKHPLPHLTGMQWVAAVWLAGTAVSLTWYLTGYFCMRWRLRAGKQPVQIWETDLLENMTLDRRPPQLRRSAGLGTPVVVGLLRPVVYLPNWEMKPEDLRYALRHELVHWKRRDLLYKWALVLTACVHWFNPMVWYLLRAASRDCELSCDEAAVQNFSERERAGYGEMLLAAAAWQNQISNRLLTPLWSQKQSLKERLYSIMRPTTNTKGAKGLFIGAVLVALIAFMMLGAYALQKAPEKPSGLPDQPPVEVPGLSVLTGQGWRVEDATVDGESVFALAHREGHKEQAVLLSRDNGVTWKELALPEPVYVDGTLAADMEGWYEADLRVLADLPKADITLYGLNLPENIDLPGVLLRRGSHLNLFPNDQIHAGLDVRANSGPRIVLSGMALADYDGDGVEELAVSNCVGTGTGCEAYELYMFEPTEDGGFSIRAALTQDDLWAQMESGLDSFFDAESLSYGIWKENGVYYCDMSEEVDWLRDAPMGELAASDLLSYRLEPLSVHMLLRPCDMPMCDVVWYNNVIRYDGTTLKLDPEAYTLEEEVYPLTWHEGEVPGRVPATNLSNSNAEQISFSWPFLRGDEISISTFYGRRTDPFTGASTFHNGLDFKLDQRTAVLAVADGVI